MPNKWPIVFSKGSCFKMMTQKKNVLIKNYLLRNNGVKKSLLLWDFKAGGLIKVSRHFDNIIVFPRLLF